MDRSDEEPLVRVGEWSSVARLMTFSTPPDGSAIPSSIGLDESVPSTVPPQTFPTWVDRDDVHDSSSVSLESCWGETEDLNDDENVEWGLLRPEAPVAAHPADMVRGSVPPDVLSALEHDLSSDNSAEFTGSGN